MILNNSFSYAPLLYSHQIHANFAHMLVPINIPNIQSITAPQMKRFQLNSVISQLTDITTISISEGQLKSVLSRNINITLGPSFDNRTPCPQCFLLYITMWCIKVKNSCNTETRKEYTNPYTQLSLCITSLQRTKKTRAGKDSKSDLKINQIAISYRQLDKLNMVYNDIQITKRQLIWNNQLNHFTITTFALTI